MPRECFLVIALLVLTGCGGGPAAGPSDQAGDSAIDTKPPMAVVADEASLWQEANRAESENRFVDAAAIWRQIHQRLVARLGSQHWQVANCDQAIEADERLAALDAEGQARLQELRRWEARIAKNSQSGAYRRAWDDLRQAQPLATKIFGEPSAIVMRLQLMAGHLAEQLRDWESAEREYALAQAQAEKIFSPPHPDLERIHFRLGMVARELGALDLAVDHLRAAQAMIQALAGDSVELAERTQELGVTLYRADQLDLAFNEFGAAERLWNKLPGNELRLAECLVNKAVAQMGLQKWTDAESTLLAADKIVAADERMLKLQQDIWLHRATILVTRKDFSAAAELLRQALAMLDRTSGKLQPSYAHVAYRLGMCLAFQAQYADAEPLFRHALDVQRNLLGPTHEDTRRTAQALAMLLQRTERITEARELLQRFAYTSGDAPPPVTQ